MRFIPTSESIGADVEGCDLNDVSDEAFGAIQKALEKYLVLRFRDQKIEDDVHLDLNARFGALDYTPERLIRGEVRIPGSPNMEVVSNVVENDKPVGALGNHELVWHSDMSFLKQPYGISILRSVELPPSGGNTSFANMFLALESMPADLRRRANGRSTSQGGFLDTPDGTLRNPAGEEAERVEGQYDGSPAIHPMIRTEPETGRQYLYLGRRPQSSVVGLSADESEELLDALWDHATRPALTWTQEWRLGDVILWDNRCTMHHRTEFDPNARRILRRTACRGEIPA